MFMEMSALVELRRRSPAGIFAVPYRDGRPRKALRLPDGAIVEVPAPGRLHEVPGRPEPVIGVASDGTPATIHHANLGLIATYVDFVGLFLLSSGEIAAVYGADAIGIAYGRGAAQPRSLDRWPSPNRPVPLPSNS